MVEVKSALSLPNARNNEKGRQVEHHLIQNIWVEFLWGRMQVRKIYDTPAFAYIFAWKSVIQFRVIITFLLFSKC